MSFKQKPPKYCKEATNTYYVLYSLEHLPIFTDDYMGFTSSFIILSFLTVSSCWAVGNYTKTNVYHVGRTDTTKRISQVTNVLRPLG